MWSDILRFVFIIVGSTAIGSMIPVIRGHYMLWRKAPKCRRLMPVHVMTVAVAQILLIVSAGWGSIDNLRDQVISYRIWFYIVACVLTTVAMYLVGSYQRKERHP